MASPDSAFTVVLISDIHIDHIHMTHRRIGEVAKRVNALHPDIILLGGDYIGAADGMRRGDARLGSHRPANDNAYEETSLRAFDAFSASLGGYAIMGNHDCYWDCSRVREIQGQNHVHLLENAAFRIDRRNGPVWIVGIEDGQTQKPDFENAAKDVPSGVATLTLVHNPGLFDWASNHASLQLSGHTHAGQVRLPFIGAAVLMSRHTNDTVKGWTIRDGRILIVTRGLGESGLPVRFGAPPQIMLLNIHHGNAPKVD
jgi:predicted MPP superfamily phosphohydrolase